MHVIRKAAAEDVPQIMAIYDQVLDREEKGLTATGWIRGIYPTIDTVQEALEAEDLFILLYDGSTAAVCRINQVQGREYALVSWRYPHVPDTKVMVLHTLAVSPDFSGKGCATALVRFYEQYALEHHCPYLRMDTNVTNKAARRLYQHLGYAEAGIVSCNFNRIPDVQLVCLEKKLEG